MSIFGAASTTAATRSFNAAILFCRLSKKKSENKEKEQRKRKTEKTKRVFMCVNC